MILEDYLLLPLIYLRSEGLRSYVGCGNWRFMHLTYILKPTAERSIYLHTTLSLARIFDMLYCALLLVLLFSVYAFRTYSKVINPGFFATLAKPGKPLYVTSR